MKEEIGKDVKIGKNCKFGKNVVIGDNVEIGDDNIFGNFISITGNTSIENNNFFSDFITIGRPSCHQIERYEFKKKQNGLIKIGSNNIFREFFSVNLPTKEITHIENECFFMPYSHISHDVKIRKKVVFANNVQTAGFSYCGENSFVGYSSATHQVSAIGGFCMIGMGTNIVKDIPPGMLAYGNPGTCLKIDSIGLSKKGFSAIEIKEITSFYEKSNSREDAKEKLKMISSIKFKESFMEFLQYSKRDISLPNQEVWKNY
jgi:UDP-N-acetylglucosamine acyltransferase